MIRRPPRSTLDRSSAASDVYKRQAHPVVLMHVARLRGHLTDVHPLHVGNGASGLLDPVSYTHLRAHETVLDLVCRLLLEQKNNTTSHYVFVLYHK